MKKRLNQHIFFNSVSSNTNFTNLARILQTDKFCFVINLRTIANNPTYPCLLIILSVILGVCTVETGSDSEPGHFGASCRIRKLNHGGEAVRVAQQSDLQAGLDGR